MELFSIRIQRTFQLVSTLLHKAEEAGLPQAGENLKILHEIY